MKKIYTIGRDAQSDIVIDDSTDVVSRLHATIRIEGRKMFLIDQSQNGTYVNGMRMSAAEEIPVTRDDVVSFANVVELNWEQIPNPAKRQAKILAFSAIALIAISATVVGSLYLGKPKSNPPVEPNTVVQTDDDPVEEQETETTEINDSVVDNTEEEIVGNTDSRSSGSTGSNRTTGNGGTERVKEEPKTEDNIPLY